MILFGFKLKACDLQKTLAAIVYEVLYDLIQKMKYHGHVGSMP